MLNWQTSSDVCRRRVIEEHPGIEVQKPVRGTRGAMLPCPVETRCPECKRINAGR